MNRSATQDAELIARWIEPHPHKPGAAEARVLPGFVSIWALIGQLQLDDWNIAAVAEDYELPVAAVEAAIAYYRQHQSDVDARIARNRAFFKM